MRAASALPVAGRVGTALAVVAVLVSCAGVPESSAPRIRRGDPEDWRDRGTRCPASAELAAARTDT